MLSKITANTSEITTRLANTATNIGSKVNNSKVAQKALQYTDPKGFNNTFGVLVGLMTTMVVAPRVITAAKRNPNDKEATKDEISEILFRDVQTCAIILFALKILNSVIASKVGKMSGLPMTNKPFLKVFDNDTKGVQGVQDKICEFVQHPLEKTKRIGKNFIDLIHPTGGVKSLNDAEFATKYSGFKSFNEVEKMFNQIDEQGGNANKVFKNKVLKNLIESQTSKLNEATEKLNSNIASAAEEVEVYSSNIKNLKVLGNKGVECFKDNGEQIDDSVKQLLMNYFKDSKNALVVNGGRLSSTLRTMALAIESIYLGFGLPALNQKRLEKKYLSNNQNEKELSEISKDNSALVGKKLDTNEAKLFGQFIK